MKDLTQIDIIALAQHTGASGIERAGQLYRTCCPFHNDRTPSLYFYPSTNSFYCFGCQVGGDAFTWVKSKFNFDNEQTFKWLEAYAPEISDWEDLSEVRDIPPQAPIYSLEMVNYWHSNLKYTKQSEWFYSRGFTEETIDRERFGWNGKRFVIPVWEGESGNSRILTLRLRRPDNGEGPKYLTPSDTIINFVWGRWYTAHSSIVIMTAGELDAAMLVQDGFPANSLVGGMGSFRNFPKGWPSVWYPHSQHLLVLFDHKEAGVAGLLAKDWSRVKGTLSSDIIHWTYDVDDYNEFRQHHSAEEFLNMVSSQCLKGCQLRQF